MRGLSAFANPGSERGDVRSRDTRARAAAGRKARLRDGAGTVIEALEERRMLAIDLDYETPPRFAKVDAYTGLAGDPSLLNVPNTFNYAHQLDPSTGAPIGYQITLTADLQGGTFAGNPSWTLSGGGSANARTSSDVSPTFAGLDLGSDFVQNFSVTLAADVSRIGFDPITHLIIRTISHETIQRTITVRDILIVSMGDSESSGEGNPEINNSSAAPPFGMNGSPGIWEDSGDSVNSTVALTDKLGHRSTKAYAAQAARRLEEG